MYNRGELPQYTEHFPEPFPGKDELLISVKAVAIKHLDKSTAIGKHYTSRNDLSGAKIIGGDGVGVLEDGTRVYAFGKGMLAEKAVVEKDRIIKIPASVDDVTAAALPNAVAGSAMALRFRARIEKGETILINGATGFTGKIAVQVARYYGAGHIIATGRNEEALQALLTLGADEIVSLKQDDATLRAQIKELQRRTPIDIVIDYLWGTTAELLLASLTGAGMFTHKTRFISVGAITGDKIQLSSEVLRSTNLQLMGSGLGSWTEKEVGSLFKEIIPEMLHMAGENKLKVDTITVNLDEIEALWDHEVPGGKRLVVLI